MLEYGHCNCIIVRNYCFHLLIQEIKLGELIAVYTEKFTERPLIGWVTSVDSKVIKFDWMIGTYTGTWKEWRGRKEGKSVIFSDSVPLMDVLYHPIELTKGTTSSSETKRNIQKILVMTQISFMRTYVYLYLLYICISTGFISYIII